MINNDEHVGERKVLNLRKSCTMKSNNFLAAVDTLTTNKTEWIPKVFVWISTRFSLLHCSFPFVHLIFKLFLRLLPDNFWWLPAQPNGRQSICRRHDFRWELVRDRHRLGVMSHRRSIAKLERDSGALEQVTVVLSKSYCGSMHPMTTKQGDKDYLIR